jgi:uncharacterized membrane protein YeaQ/YmgE (transglycosylase-associated protein family)
MSVLELIVYLSIAGICGVIASAIAGGTPGGFVVSILLGFLGAFFGTWLAHMIHLPDLIEVRVGGHPFPILWSILGGVVLVALAHGLMRTPYMGRGHPRH